MNLRLPATLKLTVPLLLLGFAAALSAVNLLVNLPRAEQAADAESHERATQELSRLQSTLEYLLLRGDLAAAQQQVALAHNHDTDLVAMADERQVVIAATRRAWIGRPLPIVAPVFDAAQAQRAADGRRGTLVHDVEGRALLGYAGVQMAGGGESLRPSRTGALFLRHDLARARGEARRLVLEQSLYWSGAVAALALALWLAFHVLLTRRSARLVQAAEQFATGNLEARTGVEGGDELGRLGRVLDTMAPRLAEAQRRLREDIAERERAQAALRVSEASYRAIFDATEDAIFVHDLASGVILDANPKACTNFGYTLDELRRLEIGALGSGERPYTQGDALVLLERAAAGEQLRFEWRSRDKGGRQRWDEIVLKRATIGGHDRVLAIARDVTDKKRAAEALASQREALYQREKLAALGSLLAGVAHELNNPLSVVVARAVLLEEQGGPSTRHAASKIRSAAERCARIVRTFLAMARRQPPEHRPVAIDEVIGAALDIAGYALRSAGIETRLDLAPGVPRVSADADQLHQVLLNLLLNAQQSLRDEPPPRRIEVRTRHDAPAGVLRITVADNGPGVPAALRARVFEPYFTTKPTGLGTGVGLAVSLGIVEAHDGTLTLDCPPGGGASFTVALPVGPAAAGARERRPPPRAAGAPGLAVLVVDDEAEIREMLAEIIAADGCRVHLAASGDEALRRLEAETFDVILTDLRMPGLDGRALYGEIAQRWPESAARVIFVTGDTLADGLQGFVEGSGRPVIEKPFLPADVRRVVGELAATASRPVASPP